MLLLFVKTAGESWLDGSPAGTAAAPGLFTLF